MSAFVIKKVNTGIMFNLKADNGQVIATSEVYTAAASCKNGIDSVRRNAPIAALEDQTTEGFATEKCPKFEMYVDRAGEFPTARSSPPAKATRPRKVAKTASRACAKTPPWRKSSRNKPPQPRLAHAASALFPRRRLFFPDRKRRPSSASEEGRFAAGRRRR